MKIARTVFLLASALVGAQAANSISYPLSGEQTAKEGICKGTIKDLMQCAGSKDYVSSSDSWLANSLCVTGGQANAFSKCRGASILYKDSVATSLPSTMGYPAYVAAGVVTKGLQYQGLVSIPSHDNKTNPFDAFMAAADSCLTTAWDRVLFDMCIESANFSTMTPNASGQVTYAFIQPELHFYLEAREDCPSVEARAKANGAVFARVGKGAVEPQEVISG